jgi:hypothetical protein
MWVKPNSSVYFSLAPCLHVVYLLDWQGAFLFEKFYWYQPGSETIMNQKSLLRFYAKIAIAEQTGCWNWTGGLNAKGYGQFWNEGHNNLAHRVSYTHFVGEIPAEHTLDHICQNERCSNPKHLEPVTNLENLIRKYAVANIQKIFTVVWIKAAPIAARS